jgi:hypothetical protein
VDMKRYCIFYHKLSKRTFLNVTLNQYRGTHSYTGNETMQPAIHFWSHDASGLPSVQRSRYHIVRSEFDIHIPDKIVITFQHFRIYASKLYITGVQRAG